MFNIGNKLIKENYTQGAIWANENNAAINPQTWVIEKITATPLSDMEIKERRKQQYIALIDTLTAQISRLSDELPTVQVAAQIEALKNERAVKVAVIKVQNPYNSKEQTND